MLSLHMPLLTAVIITLNEERNIKRCIRSLKDTVDEIIVIDSGSTDQTRSICDNEGVRFIYKEWQGYSEARNFGASMSSNRWIIALDADEALSAELKNSINTLSQNEEPVNASVKRLTNYCGKWVRHCGWYPDIKHRLYDRDETNFTGNIHESLNYTGHTKILDGDLLHYSYYTIEEHISQYNKFTTLTAREAFLKGKRSSLLQVIFSPWVKFMKSYFIQLGFLDGYYGLLICINSAHATFLKYTKLRALEKSS